MASYRLARSQLRHARYDSVIFKDEDGLTKTIARNGFVELTDEEVDCLKKIGIALIRKHEPISQDVPGPPMSEPEQVVPAEKPEIETTAFKEVMFDGD